MKKTLYFCLLVLTWTVVLFPQDIIWNNIKQNMAKKGIQVDAKEVNTQLYLLYNKVDITSLQLFDALYVDRVKIRYTLLNPLKIELNGVLENRHFKGEVDLINKNGFVSIEEGAFKNTLLRGYFKKSTEGLKYEFAY